MNDNPYEDLLKGKNQILDSEHYGLECNCGNFEVRPVCSGHDHLSGRTIAFECAACSKRRREEWFHRICPVGYTATDPTLLPERQFKETMSWEYGPTGLVLTGPSGTGKTRCAWTLLRRIMTMDIPERGVSALNCVGFVNKVKGQYPDNYELRFSERMAAVPLLFLDDFGKLKFTDRAETQLYALIERRSANMLPTIITTSDIAMALGVSENLRSSILRRLWEFYTVIKF